MKLHEVLELVKDNPDKWFRPVSWKGSKYAYCIEEGYTYVVPGLCGGHCEMNVSVEILSGDWEVVTPDTVLDGD